MLILKEIGTAQDILFIPRTYVFDRIEFTNEQDNTSVSYDVTPETQSYYGKITLILDLKEGQFYTMKVFNLTEIVYYGKVFCTNQDIEEYSINDGIYVNAPSTTNEYITI